MSADNEQLEPTPFEVAPAPLSEEKAANPLPGWVWPALAGLLLLALLVLFWLPDQVSSPQREAPATDSPQQAAGQSSDAPPAGSATGGTTTDASPWSEAQAAKLRKEAQDVLQQLLDLQFALEERGVKQWAAQEYAAAAEAAGSGDELYRQRDYIEAKAQYEQSLATLQRINDSIPAVVNEQLELARQGIEDGDVAQTASALAMANTIEPENADLAALQQRAATLEPLLALLEEAAIAESDDQLAEAQASLQQATELDPQHQRAATELQRVSAAYLDQRFNDAMSDGYSALDAGQFDKARKHFREAAGLQGGSQEAASALLEVDTAQQASRLTRLKSQGGQLEQSEQWQAAVEAYEKAAEIDGNVSFAAEGLKRSRARARLDKQFRAAIAQPERLSDVAVAEATENLLQQAQVIRPAGPVLQQQIAQLQTLLKQANTLVPVTFLSDAETEVIIYKVARLGKFQQRELTLRPGTYKVRGSRNGYRDVLETVRISHDGAPAPISITCREAIR